MSRWSSTLDYRDCHGRALTYHGTPVRASDPTGQQLEGAFGIDYTRNFKVPELLEAGDAQYTAWAELFLDMLLVSGIFEKDALSPSPRR
jgi:hypothetical protein